jgi:hypothetical protein
MATLAVHVVTLDHDKMFLSPKVITWKLEQNGLFDIVGNHSFIVPISSMREHDLQPGAAVLSKFEGNGRYRGFSLLTARGSRSIVLCTSGEGNLVIMWNR